MPRVAGPPPGTVFLTLAASLFELQPPLNEPLVKLGLVPLPALLGVPDNSGECEDTIPGATLKPASDGKSTSKQSGNKFSHSIGSTPQQSDFCNAPLDDGGQLAAMRADGNTTDKNA